jgi:hypothetical protein
MKRCQTNLAVLGAVALWGAFSCAYLGVEDGSSGLSLLGWLHAWFFVPGALVMAQLRGSHSNSDLPLMAIIGYATYSLLALGIVQLKFLFRKG